ncbi:MAG: hypothetical protein MJ211_07610 [Bacteroidales bacterium]|nr:hypothetical protein [Bacteroidales bacterium]
MENSDKITKNNFASFWKDKKGENQEIDSLFEKAKDSEDSSIWDKLIGMATEYLQDAVKDSTKKKSTKKKSTTSCKSKTSTTKKTTKTKTSDKPEWVDLMKKFISMCSTQDNKKNVTTQRISNLLDDIKAFMKTSRQQYDLLKQVRDKLASKADSDQRTQEMPMWADLVRACQNAIKSV